MFCTGLSPSDGSDQVPFLEGLEPAEQVQCCSEQCALTSAPLMAPSGEVSDNSISNHKRTQRGAWCLFLHKNHLLH